MTKPREVLGIVYREQYHHLLEQTQQQTKSIQDKIDILREKYVDLVWYARSDDDGSNQDIGAQKRRIEKKYPSEIEELYQNSSWTHGFNSGMLAAVRLLRSYTLPMDYEESEIEMTRDSEIDYAESLFPFLDT